jgi:hypothetical protein
MFSIATRWSPLYGLAMILLGAGMVKLGVSEGHEVIGGGLLMITLSRRDDDAPSPTRAITPADVDPKGPPR